MDKHVHVSLHLQSCGVMLATVACISFKLLKYWDCLRCLQAIRLIPDHVWARAQQRAVEEPLWLSKCWPAACCVLCLWNASAVGLTYILCKRLGTIWWSSHCWVSSVIVVSVLVLAEAGWLLYTLYVERQARDASDRDMSREADISSALLPEMPEGA